MFATAVATKRGKRTVSYPSPFAALPAKGFDVAMTSGAGATAITSSALRESGSIVSDGTYYSAFVFPEVMHTGVFSVTCGNAALQTSDRGIGAGVFSGDGTKGVFFIMCGNSVSCRIKTYLSGTISDQGTFANTFSTSGSDLLQLRPSLSSGVYTWTVYKNGSATACTWTDSSHVIDLPGRRFGACFRHNYSNGQFSSPGIKSMAAADL